MTGFNIFFSCDGFDETEGSIDVLGDDDKDGTLDGPDIPPPQAQQASVAVLPKFGFKSPY